MWKSGLMMEWQADYDRLEVFVGQELPGYVSLVDDSARLAEEDRREIIGSLAGNLDKMLAIPLKWGNCQTLQKKLEPNAEKIRAVRQELESRLESGVVKKDAMPDKDPVSMLIKYYRSRGIVGEEGLCILQTICAARGMHFGIEGPSGSGKTFIVDSLLNLLPSNSVFKMGADSDKAVYYEADSVNECMFIYVPELQKAMQDHTTTVEFVKDITEGKSSTRRVRAGKKTQTYTITPGKALIYTLANENRFAKDAETARRLAVLFTNTSEEHVRNVIREKTCRRFDSEGKGIEKAEYAFLKLHMAKCLSMKRLETRDPFAEYMASYIPVLPQSASFVEHYYRMLDAYAHFNSSRRLKKGNCLFLSLEDHFMVHQLYHSTFCMNLSAYGTSSWEINAEAKKMVDWEQCWQRGLERMMQVYPDVADEWKAMQSDAGRITFYDPLNEKRYLFGSIPQEEKKPSSIPSLICMGAISLFHLLM